MEIQVKHKVTILEWLVFIMFLVLALEEVLSCIAIKLESSFNIFYKQSLVVVGMTAITIILFLTINIVRYIRNGKNNEPVVDNNLSRYNPYMWMIVVVLAATGIISLLCVESYIGNDLTLEYMNSIQSRFPLFSNNPLTGSKLVLGIYPRYKFAALPYLYACIAKFFRIQPNILIYRIVPIIVFFIYLGLCYKIGKQFFPESKGRSVLFIISVLILINTGDRWIYTTAHGILHEGWKGSVSVGCVVIPFAALAVYRIVVYKQYVYGAFACMLSGIATIFCQQLVAPKLWLNSPAEFGHQAGIYFGALVILLAIRQRYPSENECHDNVILLIFALSMLFPYDGLMYPAIAYVCCRILDSMGKYSSKRVVIIGGILTFMLAGTILPFRSGYAFRQASQVDVDLLDSINQVKNPIIVGPNEIVEKARRDFACKTPYGKNLWIPDCGREVADYLDNSSVLLYENINVTEKDAGIIGMLAKANGCNVFFATPDMFALTGQEAWDFEDPEQKKEKLIGTLSKQGWEKYIDKDEYIIFIRRNA